MQMKYLEAKNNLMEGREEKQCMPMDLAVREAQFKGSLLDRITWLEKRLHTVTTYSCFSFSLSFEPVPIHHNVHIEQGSNKILVNAGQIYARDDRR